MLSSCTSWLGFASCAKAITWCWLHCHSAVQGAVEPHSPSPAISKANMLFIRSCYQVMTAVAVRSFGGAKNEHRRCKVCCLQECGHSMHWLVEDEVITSAMVSGSCCCSSASSCLSPRCLEACKQVPCQLVCASITCVLRARYIAGVQV